MFSWKKTLGCLIAPSSYLLAISDTWPSKKTVSAVNPLSFSPSSLFFPWIFAHVYNVFLKLCSYFIFIILRKATVHKISLINSNPTEPPTYLISDFFLKVVKSIISIIHSISLFDSHNYSQSFTEYTRYDGLPEKHL